MLAFVPHNPWWPLKCAQQAAHEPKLENMGLFSYPVVTVMSRKLHWPEQPMKQDQVFFSIISNFHIYIFHVIYLRISFGLFHLRWSNHMKSSSLRAQGHQGTCIELIRKLQGVEFISECLCPIYVWLVESQLVVIAYMHINITFYDFRNRVARHMGQSHILWNKFPRNRNIVNSSGNDRFYIIQMHIILPVSWLFC